MKRFLRETWELWYWAMFCPSLLQQRMNQWSPNEESDTSFSDILLFGSGRFIAQYFVLLLIFAIPLAVAIGIYGRTGEILMYCIDNHKNLRLEDWCFWSIDWLLLPVAVLIAFFVGLWLLPLGIHAPLLWSFVYLRKPENGLVWACDNIQAFMQLHTPFLLLQPKGNITLGITVGILTLVIMSLLGLKFLKLYRIVLGKYFISIGVPFSMLLGSFLANQNLVFTLIVSALTYFSFQVYLSERDIINTIKSTNTIDEFASSLFFWSSVVIGGYIACLALFNSFLLRLLIYIYTAFRGNILGIITAIIVAFSLVSLVIILIIILSLGTTLFITDSPFIILSVLGLAASILGLAASMSSDQLIAYSHVYPPFVIIVVFTIWVTLWASLTGFFWFGLTVIKHFPWDFFTFIIPVALAFSIVFSSLPIFLVSCWLLTFSFAKPHTRWKMFTIWMITGVVVWVGLEYLGLLSILAVPTLLIGYYRVFPEYLILASVSRSFSFPLQLIFSKLPPDSETLLWGKMPSRDRILVASFLANPTAEFAKSILDQPSLSPESQNTLRKAMPLIIANQLASVNTITDLIGITKLGNSILSPLISLLNQLKIPTFSEHTSVYITIIRDLIGIVEALLAPVETGNKILDRYGPQRILKMEQILNSLKSLNRRTELPAETMGRWQLVFDRWQQIIELELEEEKKKFYEYLPQAVAEQLADVNTISEIIATATPEHPVLPLLVPNFNQAKPEVGENSSSITNSPVINSEIADVLPRLQTIANDIARAMEAGSIGLRQRSLERIVNDFPRQKYELLQRQLTIWLPVIEQWERVIQQELKQQQAQSQGEVINPFQAGNPLRSDRNYLFQGRRELADEIVRMVLDTNRPTLVLHGPRRFGKTSFLYNLSRLLPSNILPVYMDMQSARVTTDDAEFCQGLIRAIHRDVRSQERLELPAVPPRQQFLDTPYIVLEDWLEQALGRLQKNQRILLNLDEFEKIGTAVREGRLSDRLLDELRHLIQHWEPLSFLFSGVQTLEEIGPNWSSYFISVKSMEIDYLKPDEAEKLLRDPHPQFTLRYDIDTIDQILILTRCHPYLLQLIGENLVKLANARQTKRVTSDLLQAAIPEAFNKDVGYFTNVWEEYTGTNPDDVAAGQQLLLKIAGGLESNPAEDDEATQAARRRLRRYHVIEQTNMGDRFEVPMLERWVRERAVLN